jgi:hypothetical protein
VIPRTNAIKAYSKGRVRKIVETISEGERVPALEIRCNSEILFVALLEGDRVARISVQSERMVSAHVRCEALEGGAAGGVDGAARTITHEAAHFGEDGRPRYCLITLSSLRAIWDGCAGLTDVITSHLGRRRG